MILDRDQQRDLRLAAVVAVERQAAEALPADPTERAREGIKRKRAAVAELHKVAKEQSPAACRCSPEQALSALQAAKLLVQTVYDFLKLFGVIGANGAKA
jgi:hypothetical protein